MTSGSIGRSSVSQPREALDPQALAQISCYTKERIGEVHGLRGGDRERLAAYLELFTSVQNRSDTLQEAVTLNPDFIYRDEYRVIMDAHEYCKEQAEGVREEFERYTRELIQTPTVQEMKKGKPQTLARVDFALLRDAVNALAPEDQGALLTRVEEAEQRVQASMPADSEAEVGALSPGVGRAARAHRARAAPESLTPFGSWGLPW